MGFWEINKKSVLVLFIFCMLFSFSSATTINTSILNDGHVRSSAPSNNYGSSAQLSIAGGSTKYFGYYEIDLSNYTSYQNDSSLQNITFKLTIQQGSGFNSNPLNFYYCNDGFNELNITWNNQYTEVINCNSSYFYQFSTAYSFSDGEKFPELDITTLFNNDNDGLFTIKILPNTDTSTAMWLFPYSDETATTSYKPVITIEYELCSEDWQPFYGTCNSSDLQLKWYVDSNNCSTTNNLPVDNGTYVACNYCSEDLEQLQANCEFNGTDFYSETTYQDNNYYSCCAITGIVSDCSVDNTPPYNESSYSLCNYYEDDFEIEYDEQALYGLTINEKVYWKFYINDSNMTEDYDCISYIKHMHNGTLGELIQVNPTYIKKVESLISLDDSFDDREYFKTVNGLGNVYFTKDNLVMDVRQYLFGIQCTGNGQKLNSERVVTTEYEKLNTPITLAFWSYDNMDALFLGVIIFIFVVGLIGTLIYIFKREIR